MCKACNVKKSYAPHRQEGKVYGKNDDAKHATRETVAAGAGTISLPHPSVVTQTDDVEPSGGINNDGGSSMRSL